ncbi:hypothetical protein A4S06_09180 [Erysipelotrichaceae bacterium MTC7]|nr:hypothetical protein A4S06_09180 [Erysipelotrichaceae bacterium MTC7]
MMQRKSLIQRFIAMFFAAELEFRVKLFHVLAMGGALLSFVMCVLVIVNYSDHMTIVVNALSTLLSCALLLYSYRSGKYQLCYMITIVGIFLGLFPFLFFASGGYHSGMPVFFIFAIVFTIFMLEGKKAIGFSILEMILYVTLCITAYLHPEWVTPFASEEDALVDIIISLVAVSLVLGVCLYTHFCMYNAQQKKLDAQNAVLAQANKMKTEFLANASHEMRTPLTVTSVNVQTVIEMLAEMDHKIDDPEVDTLLHNAQSEIMRMSRMVTGMLNLASVSENTERQKLDFTSLMHNTMEMMHMSLVKKGIAVTVDIAPDLWIFGNADLMAQVLTNLLQNALAHTKGGSLQVQANKEANFITVTVKDTGSGIAPEILPDVFERGVTTNGTGYGLYLCKTVVESHGGEIWMESKLGVGTTVYYKLPVYEGQLGG